MPTVKVVPAKALEPMFAEMKSNRAPSANIWIIVVLADACSAVWVA
nr:hypothetical protein [Streptomyces gossypiisoli]